MELLLNLIWLLLATPAYYLWRSALRSQKRSSLTSLQCLLALACALVILFPVVSATDDLHAMRAEMEESSKRSIRLAVGDRSSAGHNVWHNPSATTARFAAFISLNRTWLESRVSHLFFAVSLSTVHAGRAPPVF